jgi:hypothetical protein
MNLIGPRAREGRGIYPTLAAVVEAEHASLYGFLLADGGKGKKVDGPPHWKGAD